MVGTTYILNASPQLSLSKYFLFMQTVSFGKIIVSLEGSFVICNSNKHLFLLLFKVPQATTSTSLFARTWWVLFWRKADGFLRRWPSASKRQVGTLLIGNLSSNKH
jgi:hypothetical protein